MPRFVGLLVVALVLFANGRCLSAEDRISLNDLLDERIQKNIEYKEEFSEAAKESPVADLLVPAEEQVGQKWVDLLRFARESNDIAVKSHVLQLDYAEEIRSTTYDLEYAEDLLEKAKIRIQLAYWNTRLQLVKELAAGAGQPKAEVK